VFISDGKMYSYYSAVFFDQDQDFLYWTIDPVFTAQDNSYGVLDGYAQLA
jgi:hypothetical protein